jgi:hypothetical protein
VHDLIVSNLLCSIGKMARFLKSGCGV